MIPVPVMQFLRKMPRPATLLADDKKISVPSGGRVWPSIYQTIKVINPAKLQALDADGGLIRALDLETVKGDDEDAGDKSPDMTDLQFFGKLLSEAYDKGAKAGNPLIDAAMKLVEQMSARLVAADKEIDRLRGSISRLQAEIGRLTSQPVDEGEGGVIGAIMQGVALAAQNSGPIVPATNGAPAPAKRRS